MPIRAHRVCLLAAAGAFLLPLPADAKHRRHETAAVKLGASRLSKPAGTRHKAGRHPRAVKHPIAHPAGDPGVTIADFQFSPGSTTIKVGDTVTWSNNGPSAHTATANDGSFDTGILQKGQSGSHTFSQPGTFTYYCKVHPFMKGTITVAASGGGSGSGSSSGSSTASSSSGTGSSSSSNSGTTSTSGQTSAATNSGSLPNTGLDVFAALLTGFALCAAGLGLRRRALH
jgi:plastocyanin